MTSKPIIVGDKVLLADKRKGQCLFIGIREKHQTIEYGIELDPAHKTKENSEHYFKAGPNRATFVALKDISKNQRTKANQGLLDYTIDDQIRVTSKGCMGTIKYIGYPRPSDKPPLSDKEIYYGVELTEKRGNTNGRVDNVRYFKAKDNFGIFIPASEVAKKKETEEQCLATWDEMNESLKKINASFENRFDIFKDDTSAVKSKIAEFNKQLKTFQKKVGLPINKPAPPAAAPVATAPPAENTEAQQQQAGAALPALSETAATGTQDVVSALPEVVTRKTNTSVIKRKGSHRKTESVFERLGEWETWSLEDISTWMFKITEKNSNQRVFDPTIHCKKLIDWMKENNYTVAILPTLTVEQLDKAKIMGKNKGKEFVAAVGRLTEKKNKI